MVKVTLKDGTVVEGTSEEIYALDLFVEVAEVEAEALTFAEGDKVRALRDGQFYDIGEGQIATVCDANSEEFEDDDPYVVIVEREDGVTDYFRPQDLELVTEVEAEPAPLKVGDYVAISGKSIFGVDLDGKFGTYSGGSSSKFGRAVVDIPNLPGYVVKYEQLRKATDEEAAPAKTQAEADANDAIFTSNGRKPNELRKDDLVRVKRSCGAGDGISNGDIIEVSRDSSTYSAIVGDEWRVDAEIVTFAENRLDRN